MADTACCNLVGDLDLGLNGCFISVNTSCSTEITTACGEAMEGPSIFTVNLSAYADYEVWIGCPSKAGVSIPYIRKYDCENDKLYFIFSGKGQSFYVGDVSKYVTLDQILTTTCVALSASSTSGPAGIYMLSSQINGYGMSYNGIPIPFTTTAESTIITLGGTLAGTYYLQNFSLDAQPNQLPVVNYSLVKQLET